LANALALLRSGRPPSLSVEDADGLRQCVRHMVPRLVAGRAGQPRVEVRWNRSWGVKATTFHEAAAALVCDAANRGACGEVPDIRMGALTDLLMNLELERALVAVPKAPADLPQNEPPPSAGTAPADPLEPPTIVLRGETASIGGASAVLLTAEEANVLRAFVGQPALSRKALQGATGVSKPERTLKALTTKYGGVFAPAIILPGKPNAGGYRARVVVE
jgi:hypothetical protein